MSLELEALIAEINEVKTVEASAVTLLQALVAKLEQLGAEIIAKDLDAAAVSAALSTLTEDLKVSTEPLAAAVANTPV